ncbi:MAG: ABC transporter substrate-binding protein [Acidimicrobiales bacterium]
MCAVALVAAACGSNKGSNAGGTTDATGVASNVTVSSSGTPTPGGKLTFGLEGETDGFNPTKDRWAISGTEIGLAVFDPLVAFDADNKAQPYLAQSITPSADYKEWTITVRPKITFHDGTALTGQSIATMFNAHLKSALTRPALAPIVSATASGDLTCVIKMSSAWVSFPDTLTSQLGMVPAASMFNPDGTPTDQGGTAPVGTGPFQFKSWSPGQPFDATRYDNYWRTDSAGTQLPYLDSIEFQVIPDGSTRTSALRSGNIDMMHTSDPQEIVTLRQQAKDGSLQIVEDDGESEEDFLIVNTQDPALKDTRVRKAMALALDRDTYNTTVNAGIVEDANGPFKPSSKWYTPTDYPNFDLDAAKQLVDEYTADTGHPPSFTLGTTPTPSNDLAAQLLQQMFQAAGMTVDIKKTNQNTFVADAVLGNYQVNIWRQFGAVDPDSDAQWWYSANAGEGANGGLTLNIARNKDPQIDAGLDQGRQSADEATRKAGYAAVQKQFAVDFPYIWTNHAIWAIGAGPQVRGITNGPLPDGQPSLPIGGAGDFGGVVRFTQTWIAT